MLFQGCDLNECEAFLYSGPTVVVTVRDAQSGDALSGEVSASVRVGTYSEPLRRVASEPAAFHGVDVPGRPGVLDEITASRYTLTVSARGYETRTLTAPALEVEESSCLDRPYPVGPIRVEVSLEPS